MQQSKPMSPLDLQVQQALASAQNKSIRVQDDDVVVCPNCESELFISAVRFAKSKINFKDTAVGLINEKPFIFCMTCGVGLSHNTEQIITKKDLAAKKAEQETKPTEEAKDAEERT